MPLYKKKPFPLADPPQDLDPNELVYQIRFTMEIFRNYQEYLNRLNFYRQRVWMCKLTGKTNLTYEEALVSEQRATEKVQQFPEELVAPMLRIIQYSTLTLKDLVDAINANLQENPCEGLELHGRNEQSVCACKIVNVLKDGIAIQYQVGWLDKDRKITGTSIVNLDDLIHKKTPFSRAVLKAFVRESTSRSAPWVVHEKLAKKHGILTEPPEELRDKFTIQNGLLKISKKSAAGNQNFEIIRKRKRTEIDERTATDLSRKSKMKKEEEVGIEEPVRYPIDDLLVRPAADDPIFTDRPSLSTNFKVPMDCVGDFLMVWNFFSSFSRLLNLWPFSLDDFENALCHKDSNVLLIVESHSAILRLLIKDEGNYFFAIQNKKRKLKIKLTNWNEFLCDFLDMENRVLELLQYVAIVKRGHYGLLDTHVKLSIFRELVVEALKTTAVRARLDECIEQQQALAAKKREETKMKKEEQILRKEESETKKKCQGHNSENRKKNMHASDVDPISTHLKDVRKGSLKAKLSKRNSMQKNGKKLYTGSLEGQRRRKYKEKDPQEKQPEDLCGHLERQIEKLSIRTSSLGKDRNYSRYWFFRREGRLFVESSDSKHWGYYTTREELDALMGSLNPKGERERALQRQLEKHYLRISNALQKRSREVADKALLEEAVLRRSVRVQSQPRDSALAFLRYVNKWREDGPTKVCQTKSPCKSCG
ncbi:DDT domain-containing protein [Iris pallida]|uniref:DDT domain-containing protein n=1 Tax=Iris pallida TaxID=29817 RepID=A0AAX6FX53_IRIPA|nr:DDT domain-containing protein [Iris pallida]